MSLETKVALDLPLCQECGGRCCTGSPGIWVDPERFFLVFFEGMHLTPEQLEKRLPALGLVLWVMGGVPIPAPESVASGCAFSGAEGCSLSVTERPCLCLALIPNRATLDQEEGCLCKMPEGYSREAARERWQEYWRLHK
jgi:hypothetical protein